MKAVVLESDPVARALIAESLARAGHEVHAAADGHEAWVLLAQDLPPDIAVLDWRSEGIAGVDLARRAGGLSPVAPYVVLVAGPGEPEAAAAALAAGADDIVFKPVRIDVLDLRLRLAARTQGARRELVALRAEQAQRGRVDQLTGVDDKAE